jgi:hypothetical protein
MSRRYAKIFSLEGSRRSQVMQADSSLGPWGESIRYASRELKAGPEAESMKRSSGKGVR